MCDIIVKSYEFKASGAQMAQRLANMDAKNLPPAPDDEIPPPPDDEMPPPPPGTLHMHPLNPFIPCHATNPLTCIVNR
jgi:hypothetical protein